MSIWDGLLYAAAALVAVRSLAHLMQRRSERLIGEVQKQVDAHREREQAAKSRKKAVGD